MTKRLLPISVLTANDDLMVHIALRNNPTNGMEDVQKMKAYFNRAKWDMEVSTDEGCQRLLGQFKTLRLMEPNNYQLFHCM